MSILEPVIEPGGGNAPAVRQRVTMVLPAHSGLFGIARAHSAAPLEMPMRSLSTAARRASSCIIVIDGIDSSTTERSKVWGVCLPRGPESRVRPPLPGADHRLVVADGDDPTLGFRSEEAPHR